MSNTKSYINIVRWLTTEFRYQALIIILCVIFIKRQLLYARPWIPPIIFRLAAKKFSIRNAKQWYAITTFRIERILLNWLNYQENSNNLDIFCVCNVNFKLIPVGNMKWDIFEN